MSIENKLTTVAENQEKVFEAGRTKEWSDFWDAFQMNGNRTCYDYAFGGYSNYIPKWENIFYPKYDIKPINSMEYAFVNFQSDGNFDLEARLNECGVKLDTSKCGYLSDLFSGANISVIPEIDTSKVSKASRTDHMFYYCKCVTIRKLILGKCGLGANPFASAYYLENIVIEGEIIASVSVNSCSLTHDSLMSFINALKDYSEDTSGTVYKFTMGSEQIAKLTADELNMIEAKGWTYA